MRVKKLLFSVLLLLLCTNAAWADKYYKVLYSTGQKYRVNTLEVGKKYAIYNTAYNGSERRAGFLYNSGTKLGLHKSKDQDILIYNECFIFTLEKGAEADQYYIKSLSSGTYVDVTGFTGQTDKNNASLRITDWDTALAGDTYNQNTQKWTDNNKYKQTDANSENESYTVVHTSKVTFGSNKVFLISNDAYNNYWNGLVDGFDDYSNGHPFAFYEVAEITSDQGGLSLQDLHIYSRCDIYSAQQIYGYIKNSSNQIESHVTDSPGASNYVGEGGLANLLDGDAISYNVTNWTYSTAGKHHYYQIDLGESVSSFHIYMQRRSDGKNAPTKFELLVCDTPTGEFVSKGEYVTGLDEKASYSSGETVDGEFTPKAMELGGNYRYVRIVAKETTTPGNMCMGLSELYILPNIDVINNAFAYFDSSLPVSATEMEFKKIIDEYNNNASAVKLLSGVPIPGNKYRIYADAFCDDTKDSIDNPKYENRDIYTSGTDLKANGNYSSASDDDKAKYEWYCEQSTNGKLLFRNVKYPAKYLARGRVTEDINEAGWSMKTYETQRHGVPLVNDSAKYLTVANTGEFWVDNVKLVQNQTIINGEVAVDIEYVDDKAQYITLNLNENNSKGLCTDFVFLPVEVSGDEKRITVVASELADRNSLLTFDNQEYDLPFSRILIDNSKLPLLVSTADKHTFDGFYNRRTSKNLGLVIDADIYNNEILSGDTLEARFTIEEPFVKTENNDNIMLYRIKNKRTVDIQQQVAPHRVNGSIDIEDDKPLSPSSGLSYYASFSNRDANIALLREDDELDASTFFYFEGGEITDLYYTAFIHSAITTKKCKNANSWDDAGNIYFVQPNTTSGGKSGYAISRTQLRESNNPSDAWCTNHSSGDIILEFFVEDDGAAWEFEPVDEEEAKEALNEYMSTLATEMFAGLAPLVDGKDGLTREEVCEQYGYDPVKVDAYCNEINELIAVNDGMSVSQYVQRAQSLHMLHHEIEYGMQKLPELTDESTETFSPVWYYVKNVYGQTYATYNGGDKNMSLLSKADDKSDFTLNNLFYLGGNVVNEGTTDEYLQAHVHTMLAYDSANKVDSTLVGRNEVLFENIEFTGAGVSGAQVPGIVPVPANGAWEITATFTSNGNSENGFGSCLLASGTNPKLDKYENGFQVYLQTSGNLVVKAGGIGDNALSFTHVANAYSEIKVVLSYADGKLKVAVTNSQGSTKTVKDIGTIKVNDVVVDYIPCPKMKDITEFCTSMPVGVTIKSLSAENVYAMTWNRHNEDKDTWYVLPSSNVNYMGLAIAMDNPNDKEQGWTNVGGLNNDIFTDIANFDYSTWQFERVTKFDAHIDQLLEMYKIDNCVIYNKELFELYQLIVEYAEKIKDTTKDDSMDEAYFNTVAEAVRNYSGPMPEYFKAPRADKLYTIRPKVNGETAEALMVHVNKSGELYSTNEIYKGTVLATVDGQTEYNSRGVWAFEGSANGEGFLPLTGLKLKNIHTQTYLTSLGDNSTVLATANSAAIALQEENALASTFVKVGSNYMSMSDYRIDYRELNNFWGDKIDSYPAEISEIFTNDYSGTEGDVYSYIKPVTVDVDGEVVVTFRHMNGWGAHKQNVLGVVLKDNAGNVVYSDYHKGLAGNSHSNNIYTLEKVAAGNYKLECYVAQIAGDQVNRYGGYINIGGYVTVDGLDKTAKVLNIGNENAKWYIEEIVADKVCHIAKTGQDGHGTLTLGFPVKIPAEVGAYYATGDGPVGSVRYISFASYDSIVPANTPVVLRKNELPGNADDELKFYYSKNTVEAVSDSYMRGSLYFEPVECEYGINYYMLQNTNAGDVKLYWIYEEYGENGDITHPNSDDGGWIVCNANKAYMVLPDLTTNAVAYSLRFFNSGVTDIDEVESEDTVVEAIYDLQGRKLDAVTGPGLYIINGEKVLVK